MSILLFFIIFTIVVISHELGHFLTAKANGITVIEFSLGMGPALIKIQGKETLYALRIFPIGGACVFENEDGRQMEKKDRDEELILVEGKKKSGAFPEANVFARIATVFAGPLFNFLIAFLFSLILVGLAGSDTTELAGVTPDRPAEEAGLQAGDVIISLNGERVYLYREISLYSFLNQGEDIVIVYERDNEKYTVTLTPEYDETDQRYYIGFQGVNYIEPNALQTIQYSYYEVRYWIKYSVKSLKMLISGQVSTQDVSGPIGMAQMVDDVYDETKDYGLSAVALSMINIGILISVNLGVINLLPLPALDGGRLVFLIIEAIRRKPVPPEKEGFVHFLGFVALMILMVFIVFNDISKFFN